MAFGFNTETLEDYLAEQEARYAKPVQQKAPQPEAPLVDTRPQLGEPIASSGPTLQEKFAQGIFNKYQAGELTPDQLDSFLAQGQNEALTQDQRDYIQQQNAAFAPTQELNQFYDSPEWEGLKNKEKMANINDWWDDYHRLAQQDPDSFALWEQYNPAEAVRFHARAANKNVGQRTGLSNKEHQRRADQLAAAIGPNIPSDFSGDVYSDITDAWGPGDHFQLGTPSTEGGGLMDFIEDNPWQTAGLVAAAIAAPYATQALTPALGATGAGAVTGGGLAAGTNLATGQGLDPTDILTGAITGGALGWAGAPSVTTQAPNPVLSIDDAINIVESGQGALNTGVTAADSLQSIIGQTMRTQDEYDKSRNRAEADMGLRGMVDPIQEGQQPGAYDQGESELRVEDRVQAEEARPVGIFNPDGTVNDAALAEYVRRQQENNDIVELPVLTRPGEGGAATATGSSRPSAPAVEQGPQSSGPASGTPGDPTGDEGGLLGDPNTAEGGANDAIVQYQIWEAATRETNPQVKERIIRDYEEYSGEPYDPNKPPSIEQADTTGTGTAGGIPELPDWAAGSGFDPDNPALGTGVLVTGAQIPGALADILGGNTSGGGAQGTTGGVTPGGTTGGGYSGPPVQTPSGQLGDPIPGPGGPGGPAIIPTPGTTPELGDPVPGPPGPGGEGGGGGGEGEGGDERGDERGDILEQLIALTGLTGGARQVITETPQELAKIEMLLSPYTKPKVKNAMLRQMKNSGKLTDDEFDELVEALQRGAG